jgi:hypothetical protein
LRPGWRLIRITSGFRLSASPTLSYNL